MKSLIFDAEAFELNVPRKETSFMEIENEIKTEKTAKVSLSKRHLIFFLVLIGLIVFAIMRSNIATRLDSFTIDEAYHIGAVCNNAVRFMKWEGKIIHV